MQGACPTLKAAPSCAADLTALVRAGCVGQSKCDVKCLQTSGSGPKKPHACTAGAHNATIDDPCYDTAKQIGIEIACDVSPGPAPPTPAPPVPAADDWVATAGPIVFDSLYNGEHYNASMELPGWSTAAFDFSSWTPAYAAGNDSASSALLAYVPTRF